MIHLKKSPECCSQFSSNFWPGNALPLGDGSGGITTGMFLQRCTESFNPMSTQFFPFYSQQLWGLCVYLYSPHATLPRGERRTAEILLLQNSSCPQLTCTPNSEGMSWSGHDSSQLSVDFNIDQLKASTPRWCQAVAVPQGHKAMSKHIFTHPGALPALLWAAPWRAGLFQTSSSQSYSVSLKTPSHCF